MRKQELIHLHALCVELRRYFEDHHDLSSDPFQSYEEFGVSPLAVHHRKQFHEEALFRLLIGLATFIDAHPAPASPTQLSSPTSEHSG